MASQTNGEPKVSNDWSLLAEGDNGQVWIHREASKELKKLRQNGAEGILSKLCKNRFCRWKNEDAVFGSDAFKHCGKREFESAEIHMIQCRFGQNRRSIRAYGAYGTNEGIRAFFIGRIVNKNWDQLNASDLDKVINRMSMIRAVAPNAIF